MDKAAIFTDLTRRNALRKAQGLPLLDVRKEYGKAYSVARLNKWFAFMKSKKDDMKRIKAEVLAEYRVSDPAFPSYGPCTLGLVQETYIRFSRYADEHYREEFAEFCARDAPVALIADIRNCPRKRGVCHSALRRQGT